MTLPAMAVGKNAPARRMYTGRRAPQLISGVTRIVTSRSRGLSNMRVESTAGTVQPKPMSIEMKLLPCRPTWCMTRSTTKAARAM